MSFADLLKRPTLANRDHRKIVELPVPRRRFIGWYMRSSGQGVAHVVWLVPDGNGFWRHELGCRLAPPGCYEPTRGRKACRICARVVEGNNG